MDRPTISLVTGAGRGLGVEVARQLAERGHQVIVTGREESRLAEVVAGLSGEGHRAVRLDVTDAAQVRGLPEQVGRLDVLINNAAAYVDWAETATNADLGARTLGV